MTRLAIFFTLLVLQGCAISQLPHNLSRSMINQDDPALVRSAVPAYLMLLDALVETYPNDDSFLLSAAKLYGAAGLFADTDQQKKSRADRAQTYARRALCENLQDLCAAIDMPVASFQQALADSDEDDVHLIYGFAAAWAGWVQANSDDWNAVAQLPKIKALFRWLIALQADYDKGTALVYMGVLESQLPPSLGGKPEVAKGYFEQAISLSNGRHLMAKVLYAEQYARLLFEQELHDRLLNEVLAADPKVEGLTLINHLARQRAQELLDSSDEYF